MATTHNWFVNRRPVHKLDTPCLTKHFLIKPRKERPGYPTLNVVSEDDHERRKIVALDFMRLADQIADCICENNDERFLARYDEAHPKDMKILSLKDLVDMVDEDGSVEPVPVRSLRTLHKRLDLETNGAFTNSVADYSWQALDKSPLQNFSRISELTLTRSRYQTLFLEYRNTREPTASDLGQEGSSPEILGEAEVYESKQKSGFLEMLVDIHTEYMTVQFRLYPFCDSYTEFLKKKFDGTELQAALDELGTIKAVLRGISNVSGDKAFKAERAKHGKTNSEWATWCEGRIDEIYNQCWDKVGVTQARVSGCLSGFSAVSTAIYDRYSGLKYDAKIARGAAYIVASKCQRDPKDPDSEKKIEAFVERLSNRCPLGKYKNTAYISNLTEGMIVRRVSMRTNRSPKLEWPKKGEEKVYENLRNQEFEDIDTYNSGVFSEDYRPFYESCGEDDVFTQRIADHEALIAADNIRQLEEHSIFYKKILGFWPSQPDRKTTARDTHAGSAVMSGFLNGIALNGMTYLPSHVGGGGASVARYFLIYAGSSRNQLSRLLRRLHACGDNRVMLADKFLEFKSSALALSRLDQDIENSMISNSVDIRSLRDQRKELGDIKSKVTGGLQHRILQTEYYWDELQTRLDDLEETRIRGWQSYGQFVRRVYIPQINSFKRTKDRLEAVETRIERARELIQMRFATYASFALMLGAFVGSLGIIARSTGYLDATKSIWNNIIHGTSIVAGFLVAAAMFVLLLRQLPLILKQIPLIFRRKLK